MQADQGDADALDARAPAVHREHHGLVAEVDHATPMGTGRVSDSAGTGGQARRRRTAITTAASSSRSEKPTRTDRDQGRIDTRGGYHPGACGGSLRDVSRWLTAYTTLGAAVVPRWLLVYVVLGAGAVAASKWATGEIAGWALYLLVSATPEVVLGIKRYLAEHEEARRALAEEERQARRVTGPSQVIRVRQLRGDDE